MANSKCINRIDFPSLCNWPINVQCPQCLPQCMFNEIGFDLIKWNIEGLLSRSMYFLCQINVFESWILESLEVVEMFWRLIKHNTFHFILLCIFNFGRYTLYFSSTTIHMSVPLKSQYLFGAGARPFAAHLNVKYIVIVLSNSLYFCR